MATLPPFLSQLPVISAAFAANSSGKKSLPFRFLPRRLVVHAESEQSAVASFTEANNSADSYCFTA